MANIISKETDKAINDPDLRDFQRLRNRLAKRLEVKGMTITPAIAIYPTAKPKSGIMDNIGNIIDSDYNTYPIKHYRTIELV